MTRGKDEGKVTTDEVLAVAEGTAAVSAETVVGSCVIMLEGSQSEMLEVVADEATTVEAAGDSEVVAGGALLAGAEDCTVTNEEAVGELTTGAEEIVEIPVADPAVVEMI